MSGTERARRAITLPRARRAKDDFGTVEIPAGALYGKATGRWEKKIGIGEPLPSDLISSLALVKKACAFANRDCGVITQQQADMIAGACDEIIDGGYRDQFPISISQSGSGTFTNMNMNEVIARIAHIRAGGDPDAEATIIHPNDVVNRSQSTNDIFPTAMYVSSVLALRDGVLPAVGDLVEAFRDKGEEYADVIKAGRTHLMDAVPIRLGQEIDAWGVRVQGAEDGIRESIDRLSELSIGGTALGSEINAPDGFAKRAVAYISEFTGHGFRAADNKAVGISSHDPMVSSSGAMNELAATLISVTSNIRWLASGPRTGFAELKLPGAEPGSSIMPGKVNPTIPEAVQQMFYRVMGNHHTISLANLHSSDLDMNTAKPVIAENFLASASLLSSACTLLREECILGIEANPDVIEGNLNKTLMTVTALTPDIGYDRATAIAVKASEENLTLREAALVLGVSVELFDNVVDPAKMVAPFQSGIRRRQVA